MTDEEKAEDYLRKGVCQGCSSICEGDCAFAKPIRNAVLYGLAEGRKEGYAQGEQMLMASGEVVKKGFLDNLEEENKSQKQYIENLKNLIRTCTFFNEGNDIGMYQLWKGIKMEIGND